MSLSRLIWAGAATLAAPGLRLLLRVRLARGKEATGRLNERRGVERAPRPPGRVLWLHAASVGETTSVLPVLDGLLRDANELTVLFTTGTLTAAALLAQRLAAEDQQQRVLHRFVPLDVPGWAARFLDHWRPDAAVFVESELWPNLLAACEARGIPLMLCNARMSARSFDRWRRMPRFAREVLRMFLRIQPRSEEDAERLRRLGATNLAPPADLKFAAAPLPVDAAELVRLKKMLKGRPLWLAASTHPGEEAVAFAVHRALAEHHPDLLTIVAPRHPERGAAIAAEAAPLTACRRSQGETPPGAGIWIADTLGEMGLWYRLARIVFVGRSLLPPGGGQNPLEPARLGCAIATGPHTANFAEHVLLLRRADALEVVTDASDLSGFVATKLGDPDAVCNVGCRAEAALRHHSDVVARTAGELRALLDRRG
jgi:3-deoxy-D-manno-octulosonic-acid transferase